MANLSEDVKYWLNIINTATKGEDVRDAIIRLLEIANTGVGNAYTLNGHPASDFALQSQMDDILPLDNEPKLNGTHPLASGGLYDFFYRNSDENPGLIYALSLLLEDYNADTLTGKIYKLGQIRKDIRDAINTKSKTVDPRDAFDTYADKIRDIAQNPNIELQTINITDNGEFVADEDKGYKTVNVDVSSHLKTKTISKPGTYKAEDDDAYGYKEVEVELSTGSSGSGAALISKTVDASNLPDTPQAVTFKPGDDSEGAVGYSQVTVDVTSKIGPYDEIEIDPWSFEEDTFKASEETPTLYGWSSVTIRVKESTGPFTVEFWNGSTKLQTVTDVPAGGTATYTGPTPTSAVSGQVFSAWSPEPRNVTHNMKCYATFRNEEQHSASGEISISWKDIAADKGASVLWGEHKVIYYKPFYYNGIHIAGGALCMMKVNKNGGENGTTSTFLSTQPITLRDTDGNNISGIPWYLPSSKGFGQTVRGWSDSNLKKDFLDALRGAMESCSEERYNGTSVVISSISPVVKYTTEFDYGDTDKILTNTETVQGLWIPSRYEMQKYIDSAAIQAIEDAGTIYEFDRTRTLPTGYSFDYNNTHTRSITSAGKSVPEGSNAYDQLIQYVGSSSSGDYMKLYWRYRDEKSGKLNYDQTARKLMIGFCL